MKTNNIFDILDLAVNARSLGHILNPLFVSAPGLGKTEITQQWARSRGYKVIVLSLSTMDPPDLKGFPYTRVDTQGNTRLSFALPELWPTDPASKGILILEELNRCPSSVMQSVLSLTDARRGVDGYKLPEGWIIAANINPDSAEYDTSSMDPALQDRFEAFKIEYDKKSFLEYIRAAEYDPSVVGFISADLWKYDSPENIKKTAGSKYVANRTWSRLNSALQAVNRGSEEGKQRFQTIELSVYESILGRTVAAAFYSFRNDEAPVMLEDLLKPGNMERCLKKLKAWSDPKNMKNGMLSFLCEDLIANAEDVPLETLVAVLKVIPAEHGIQTIHNMERKSGDYTLLEKVLGENPDLKKVYSRIHSAKR